VKVHGQLPGAILISRLPPLEAYVPDLRVMITVFMAGPVDRTHASPCAGNPFASFPGSSSFPAISLFFFPLDAWPLPGFRFCNWDMVRGRLTKPRCKAFPLLSPLFLSISEGLPFVFPPSRTWRPIFTRVFSRWPLPSGLPLPQHLMISGLHGSGPPLLPDHLSPPRSDFGNLKQFSFSRVHFLF